MRKISVQQYSDLKQLLYSDGEAIKYPMPIKALVKSDKDPSQVYVIETRQPADYLVKKLPWLGDMKYVDEEKDHVDIGISFINMYKD